MLKRTLVISALCLACPLTALADPATKTVRVDCAKGQSIQQALAHPADSLIIEVSGMCRERVVITRSNVTLRGSDPLVDGITGPAIDDVVVQRALVQVVDQRDVRFENLTITGSESRGLEGRELAFVDVVNCRITGNAGRGLQIGGDAFANVEDSLIADNGGIDLITFTGGLVSCTRCEIDDDNGFVVAALIASRMTLDDSSVTSGGNVAVLADNAAFIYATNTDAGAGFVAIYAAEASQITWTGGELAGSAWADSGSQLFLNGPTQTANLAGNLADHNSHFQISGGTFVGDTRLTGFAGGTAEGGPTFDTLSCDRGGDLYCDGSETKSGSSCGLCP